MARRNWLFPLIPTVMFTGALFLVGASLASQNPLHVWGIRPLAPNMADVIAFAVAAVTAVLLIVALVAFAIAEYHSSGGQSMFNMKETRVLLAWLAAACATLALLAIAGPAPISQGILEDEPPAEEDSNALKAPITEAPEEQRAARTDLQPGQPPPGEPSAFASWTGMITTLVLIGLVLVLVIVRKAAPPVAPPIDEAIEPSDLAASDQALRPHEMLRTIEDEPDPRTAVIMCFRLFLSVLRQCELDVLPYHTPGECSRMAIDMLNVQRSVAMGLANLYSIARFSEHPMNESHRASALTHARQLVAHLCRDSEVHDDVSSGQ